MPGKQPILMSRDNPSGHKLEELLDTMIAELVAKTERLEHDAAGLDAADAKAVTAGLVIGRNRRIIEHLHQAAGLQRQSLAILDRLGPDQGPTGTRRV